MRHMTRREAVQLLGIASTGAWFAIQPGLNLFAASSKHDSPPALAPGAPNSPERLALIESFKKQSEGLQDKYEAYTYKGDLTMPYRLFKPAAGGKLPLVVFLSGSGGQGTDNEKQLGLGNIFGTRVWLLPENQKKYPCYVLAPQTDRGWARYDFAHEPAKQVPGLGDGLRLTLEIIAQLTRELPIDEKRIYITGQSMGGGGVWQATAHSPKLFAAAVPCCGITGFDAPVDSLSTPMWAFHGTSDQIVPVSISRDRIAALRKAGGHPLYTEYAGVDHNVWEWAYTEPDLVTWMFAQRRS